MNYDQSTGIIEMFMDSLEVTDEGTFTFNLVDGKAKGTTSLVLIGDGKNNKQCFVQPCLIWIQNNNNHLQALKILALLGICHS